MSCLRLAAFAGARHDILSFYDVRRARRAAGSGTRLFHGTGDLFSAILIAHLLDGLSLVECTRRAMDGVYQLIDLNRDMRDKNRGILVERFLSILDDPTPSQ